MARKIQIPIMTDASDRERLNRLAAAAGLSRSAYVRKLLIEADTDENSGVYDVRKEK